MPASTFTCDDPRLTALFARIEDVMRRSVMECVMLGRRVRGYRTPDAPSIWLRDYSDMLRGVRYRERDVHSVIEHFAETQSAAGWLFDYFTTTPEKVPCERENWAKYVRVPVEADVEYRFVKALWLAWQACGDDAWMGSLLPAAERALAYTRGDPWRWDAERGMVKRAYTIDTWDFDYTAGREPWLNFQCGDETFWGIMHGDNSGYYEACRLLAAMYRARGDGPAARRYEREATALRARVNALCFNGRFYRHFVPITPVAIPGAREARQLSLSNPMDINRGLATPEMAASIIREYRRRGRATRAFAPWFSIDPPFPDGVFGDERLVAGAYCNGGIMPLVGGELARAAFEHGEERFALRQLLTYETLTRSGETYLWYFPDGRHASIETSTSPDASPADMWGSTAMLYAFTEGLAGVQDTATLFRRVRLSPRWCCAGVREAELRLCYPSSGASFAYAWRHEPRRRSIALEIGGASDIDLHLLLPSSARSASLRVDGRSRPVTLRRIASSLYADARFGVSGATSIVLTYA